MSFNILPKRIFLVIALCAAAFSALAQAQDNLETRQAAVDRYLKAIPMKILLRDIFTEIAKQKPQNQRDEYVSQLMSATRIDELERISREAMVKTFTTDEINALADFLGSKNGASAMQKYGVFTGQITPAIQQEVAQILQRLQAQTPKPPKIIVGQSGKVTNVTAEGNLASYQAVGCIPLAEAKNTLTPADIHKGVGQCIEQGNYDFAARLYLLAFMYGIFDAERITDKTAGQAILVLNMNTFSNVPQDKKIKADEAIKHIAKDSELLGKLCGEINKIGPPDYYPSYMILHGVKAFTGNPHDGALVKNFNTLGVWKKIQSKNLKCPN